MNRKVLEEKVESLQLHYNLTDDHIRSVVIRGQIELLETLLEALPQP